MSWSGDLNSDDPDTEVERAIIEVARLTTDPVFKRWCQSYLDGIDDKDDDAEDAEDNLRTRQLAAISAVRSVWPTSEKMIDAERLLLRLESGVPDGDAVQWAMAAAAFAALELIRFYRMPADLQSPECQRAAAIARHAVRLARLAKPFGSNLL